VTPDLGGELWQARAFEQRQQSRDSGGFALMGGRLLLKNADGEAGVEVELVEEEVVGVDREDVVRLEGRLGKVADGEGDDNFGVGADGCSRLPGSTEHVRWLRRAVRRRRGGHAR
jgi:hypothetical protein